MSGKSKFIAFIVSIPYAMITLVIGVVIWNNLFKDAEHNYDAVTLALIIQCAASLFYAVTIGELKNDS
jgi:uncharacterized membrane protein AbrB (regulator of aidB expression)